jgi:hypothetical protein
MARLRLLSGSVRDDADPHASPGRLHMALLCDMLIFAVRKASSTLKTWVGWMLSGAEQERIC